MILAFLPGGRVVMSGVLIVDDERLIRLLLSRALKKEGINVIDADCGMDALEKINKRRFDLVVLDLRLGDISGIDILRDIKKKAPDTKVIVVTAYGSEDLLKEISQHGVEGFFEKPFDTFEVIGMIKQCLTLQRPENLRYSC